MVPPNTQLMGVQQSLQGEKINNTYIYTHFYSAISFKVPLLLIKETVQTKQPCDPLPGTEKSRRGRLQPAAARGAAEMPRHLEKKTKQTPPKELEFYFQSRKRLYFRVVTQYLLQPQRMLTERVCLLAVRGAGAGSAATRWLVFGDQRGLGQYIEPWHMGTAVTGPGASQGHCSAGSTQELHCRLSGDELSAEAVRWCSHRTTLAPAGWEGLAGGGSKGSTDPKKRSKAGCCEPVARYRRRFCSTTRPAGHCSQGVSCLHTQSLLGDDEQMLFGRSSAALGSRTARCCRGGAAPGAGAGKPGFQ